MTTRLDPGEWARVYEGSTAEAQAYVFRRSNDVALAKVHALRRPGERWLDLGCGPARAAAQLSGDGFVAGIDVDVEQLRIARELHPHRRFALIAGEAEHLPFATGQWDGVIAVSVAGCLAEPDRSFAEVARVLRPDGVAVMTFTNRSSWLLRLNYALPRRWIASVDRGSTRGHYRLFEGAAIRSSLEGVGLMVEHLSFYNHVLHVGRWLIPSRRLAPRLDGNGFPRLGRNILVVARKRASDARGDAR